MLKTFLFVGSMHANNVNELLIKCGYEKIYENIATPVEILHQLSAKNINVLSSDLSELVPVSSDLLAQLAEDELTRELFIEVEEKKKLEKTLNIRQTPTSWLKRITDFLGL